MEFFEKQQQQLKLELSHDLVIPLLRMHLEKNLVQKGTCIPVFIAVLFTIAKTWKQPKCPSTGEQIRKMWCTYNRILLSN